MTCIVGLVKGGTVWLGGDSAATNGHLDRTIIKDPKVFVRGEIGFGVCGSPKVMDALAHAIEMPVQIDGDDRAFLVSVLIPAIRDGLVKLDAAGQDSSPFGGGPGITFEGAVLLAYRGNLYRMESNFQLISGSEGYDSIGSGGALALGSLAATKKMGNARKRVITALEAACGNAGVAPPFVIVTVKKSGSLWK
jgi:ATP-dependent protease HslVU (ClpYQ) peptidase subunit